MTQSSIEVHRAREARRWPIAVAFALAALALPLVWSSAAIAGAVIHNRDDKEYKVTIIEGDKKNEHTLKPNSKLDNICEKGCIARLNDSDDDEYELEPTDVVSIEDGSLFYDEPETAGADKNEEQKKK